jgi:hypothetical protein
LPDSGASDELKNDTREKLLVLLDRKISIASTKSEKEEMQSYILETANILYSTKSKSYLVYECLLEYSDIADPLEFDSSIFQQFRECNKEILSFHDLATAFINWKEDRNMIEAMSAVSVCFISSLILRRSSIHFLLLYSHIDSWLHFT